MIDVEIKDGVAWVEMNRPAQRNAMSDALVAGLIGAFTRLGGDAAVRAMVLAGAGRGFCAGSDLAGLAAMDDAGRRRFEAESGRLARLLGALPQPVIAAVDGFAIGGGMTLATSCDLIVSEAGAKWALPEVPIGLFPAWGIASVVHRVGRPVAKRLSWGIETLSGTEAYDIGLVDYVVASDARAKAGEIAAQLATLPAVQAGFVKQYFAATSTAGDEEADAAANDFFIRATATEEAAASFLKFGARAK
jgi:enoyl-CoA hydratase/carnithine racemase